MVPKDVSPHVHLAAVSDEPYRCCGCGTPSLDGVKPCECPTGLGYRLDAKGHPNDIVRFITPDERADAKLAQLIRTRLLGVDPGDQDLELEDHDWERIIAALDGAPKRSASYATPDLVEELRALIREYEVLVESDRDRMHLLGASEDEIMSKQFPALASARAAITKATT